MPGFDFQQRQTQSQVQTLSQKQLQSLKVLSLASQDLRSEIYSMAETNPALSIKNDSMENGVDINIKNHYKMDLTKTSSHTSKEGEAASENFQAVLEAQTDERETLQEHLLHQLNVLSISTRQKDLAEKLIYNLNDKGFHILNPLTIKNKNESEEFLQETISLIQNFDPVGTCTKDSRESLYVQAKQNKNCPALALWILKGHLDFLNPPKIDRVSKRISAYVKEQKNMFASKENLEDLSYTDKEIETAINFIRTLDPFPAKNFGVSHTHFVSPDVIVEKLSTSYEDDYFEKGIVSVENNSWLLKTTKTNIPDLQLNPEIKNLLKEKNNISDEDKKKLTDQLREAKDFINTINYRQNTILRACLYIVKIQHKFFEKGNGNLVPLRMKDIADFLGVHETTISRMANSKYIQCEWGIFEIKYFFTNSIVAPSSLRNKNENNQNSNNDISRVQENTSKDMALNEITKILEENKTSGKALSDNKIAAILESRGIKISRRTVAKYRSQLNIQSSYNR